MTKLGRRTEESNGRRISRFVRGAIVVLAIAWPETATNVQAFAHTTSLAVSVEHTPEMEAFSTSTSLAAHMDRRAMLGATIFATGAGALFGGVSEAHAATDCYTDCFKNCKLLAPKDLGYCQDNCTEYCAQENRTDGLSGSVSSEGGYVGILGGSFGTGNVPKGNDKPPTIKLPGLDFTSPSGRKLIGY
jgi:hypothetical protein